MKLNERTVLWQAQKIEELECQLADLRERIALYEGTRNAHDLIRTATGMENKPVRILHMLLATEGTVRLTAIIAALYADVMDPNKNVHVAIYKLRQRLLVFGIKDVIVKHHGYGYHLTPTGRAQIAAFLACWQIAMLAWDANKGRAR